jgi:hypothetical protein
MRSSATIYREMTVPTVAMIPKQKDCPPQFQGKLPQPQKSVD